MFGSFFSSFCWSEKATIRALLNRIHPGTISKQEFLPLIEYLTHHTRMLHNEKFQYKINQLLTLYLRQQETHNPKEYHILTEFILTMTEILIQ